MTHQRLQVGSKKHVLSLAKGPSSKAAHGLAYPAGDLFAWLIPKGDTFAWLIPQGDTIIYARSVRLVPEHGKMAGTPLAAFFNRPIHEVHQGQFEAQSIGHSP